jgi:1-acyl-sn-glycerol-3-phosphate acyltransferase
MVFCLEVPYKNKELQNQTELTDVNDEYFKTLIEEPKFLSIHKIFQFLCFFVFLGPFKIIVCMIVLVLWLIAVNALPFFESFFKTTILYKMFCHNFLKKILRVFLFGLGFIYIDIEGKVPTGTRVIVSNHLSFLDFIIYLYALPVTLVKRSNQPGPEKFFTSSVLDIFYLKTGKSISPSEQLANLTSDPSFLPVLAFPEERPTSGDAVLLFRRSPFCTDYSIQPAAIRYYLGFTPPGFNSIYTNDEVTLRALLRVFSCPFFMCKVKILDEFVLKGNDDTKKLEPEEKSQISQLRIANELGVLAIAQNIFPKKKKQQ